MSKRLATIVTDVPITLDLEKCRTSHYDRDRVMEVFRELGFRSLVDRLPKSEKKAEQLMLLTSEEKEGVDYQVVTTRKALEMMTNRRTALGTAFCSISDLLGTTELY